MASPRPGPMTELSIDRDGTALVVIDLQEGIARNPALRPHSAPEVVANAVKLANAFRSQGMPVFLVHMWWRRRRWPSGPSPTRSGLPAPGPPTGPT